MLFLIVEDNHFNAFCLSRILTATLPQCQVRIAADSTTALSLIALEAFDAVILDGNLGAGDGMNCNGPALADTIWQQYPWMTIVAWSDAAAMRHAFAEVFMRHNKIFNGQVCWPKIVGEQRIQSFCRSRNVSNVGLQSGNLEYLY